MRTNAKTTGASGINTFFIKWTGICCGAVLRLYETVVVFAEKVLRTATGIAVQTNEISRTVVINTTNNFLETQFEWISFVTRRTVTVWLVVIRSTNRILTAFIFQVSPY